MPPALEILQVITPSILSLPLLSLALPSRAAPAELPGIRAITVKTVTPRRGFILLTLVLLAATCAAEALILITDILTARYRDPSNRHSHSAWYVAAGAAHSIGGLCVYSLAAIFAEYRLRWGDKSLVLLALAAFGLEVPNLVLAVIREVHAHPYDRVFAILNIPPSCLRLIFLPILIVLVLNPVIKFVSADERTGLLADTDADTEANAAAQDVAQGSSSTAPARNTLSPGYGTFNGGSSHSRETSTTTTDTGATPTPAASDAKGAKINIPKKLGEKKEESQGISWKAFSARLWKLWPHLWPSTSWRLQVCCVLCVLFLLVGRAVNALVPQTIGVFVRTLTENQHGGIGPSPWPPLIFYIALRFMQSGGVLAFAQNVLWIPVQQYADREMQLLCFNHLLDLSLAFHTKRNTGEVLRIIDRGSAINNLFQTLLFNAAPTMLDIIIYSSIFFHLYGPFLSGFMVLTMTAYVTFSLVFTGYRTKLRREMVERDVKTRGIAADVLTNWESVKYFTAEARETRRFADSIRAYQVTESRVTVSFNLLNLVQSFIITLGLLMGSVIIAWQILNGPWDGKGQPDAASFIVFLMYIQQLMSPLDRLGTLYRQLNVNATDAEKLFTLLSQPTEIRDKPGAKELVVSDGVIEFDNVCFSYDKQVQALKNVSFRIGKGESMALVGESGSGKSTILRLLYRFYDIDSGVIRIDGQDISTVTQSSLRRAIGIVPQDSVLWNDTIGANISYGKEGADDDQIIAAALAAKLHERILSFPEGYATVVGERGVRLSGGEKQRVSLARMFLKSPAILVLDEATSALDTETEREIQKALAELAKGRSSLSIAHRLSTIINSDQIVVMKDGNVIEHGSYQELIEVGGQFSIMWKKQIFTEAEMEADATTQRSLTPVPPFRLEPAGDVHILPQPAEASGADGNVGGVPVIMPFSLEPVILQPAVPQDEGMVYPRTSPPSTVAEDAEDLDDDIEPAPIVDEVSQDPQVSQVAQTPLDTPVARVLDLSDEAAPVQPVNNDEKVDAYEKEDNVKIEDTVKTEDVKAEDSVEAAEPVNAATPAEPVDAATPVEPVKTAEPAEDVAKPEPVVDPPQSEPAPAAPEPEVSTASEPALVASEPVASPVLQLAALEPATTPVSLAMELEPAGTPTPQAPAVLSPHVEPEVAFPLVTESPAPSEAGSTAVPSSTGHSVAAYHSILENPTPKHARAVAFPDAPPSSGPPSLMERPDTPIKRADSPLKRADSPLKRADSPTKRHSIVAFPSDLPRPVPSRQVSAGSHQAPLNDTATPSDGAATPPLDGKRRKRLNSIKAFARRLSTDTVNTSIVPMTRSHSSNSGPERDSEGSNKKRMSFDDKRTRRRSFQGLDFGIKNKKSD